MARKITKELTKSESMTSKKRKPSSSNQKPNEESRKLIRFDFLPGTSPEEIAKGLNDMVKKYQKDK